ncbi:MAG: divalent-cation tolerance protein CutA, partial [Acidobacteria bacterium]|nr:divalent-cation tolerance protein CutA [Acidobacteriota bacterium]
PAAYPKLEQAIRELHSYQTPEIIALPVTTGSAEYLSWVQAAVSRSPKLLLPETR